MKAIFQLFWNICLFKHGPDVIPTSRVFTGLVLVMYLLVAVAKGMVDREMPLSFHFWIDVFYLILITLVCWSTLRIWSLQKRFIATLTAILGTDALMGTIFIAYILFINFINLESFSQDSPVPAFVMMVGLTIMFWDIVIKGFIFERSLGVSRLVGVMLYFCVWMITLKVNFDLKNQYLPDEQISQLFLTMMEYVHV